MIGRAGRCTQTPSATPLQLIKWNAHFWNTFNFWWSAGLLKGLEHHLPALSSQKNEMLIFGLHSLWMIGQAGQWTQTPSTTPLQPIKWNASFWIMFTTDDQPGWSMDSNPIHHPSPANKMKCFFLDYVHYWWSARLVNGLKPHLPPLSSQKNEMLIFGLCSTSDDWLSCSIDLNPIHHPSPPKNMKCLSLYNIQHLMLARLVKGHKPHLPPLFSQKNEMLLFWIMLNFWWLAGLVVGLKPHPPPLSSQKMTCSFLDYVQLLIISRAGRWTQTPSATPLQLIKWNAHFWNTFNFWWSAGLLKGLEHHLPALSSQKNEMLLFGLRSTSDDRLGWLMDSNPICQPSPAKKWNATFWITFNFWWLAWLVNGLEPHLPALSSQKNEMLLFGLCSTSDDWLG